MSLQWSDLTKIKFEAMVEALAFYADEANYEPTPLGDDFDEPAVHRDRGITARAILGGHLPPHLRPLCYCCGKRKPIPGKRLCGFCSLAAIKAKEQNKRART